MIEEVLDAGQSGATLNRPGLDRVRDLVLSGGIAVLIVQNLDRLTREAEHYRLLLREFRKGDYEVIILNRRGASAGSGGYRSSVRAVTRPREEWVAVPVPYSGLSWGVIDVAREAVRDNRWNTGGAHRLWELSGGILRRSACGSRMRTCVSRKKPDKV